MGLSSHFLSAPSFLLPLALQKLSLRPLVPSSVCAAQQVPHFVQSRKTVLAGFLGSVSGLEIGAALLAICIQPLAVTCPSPSSVSSP